MRNLINRVILVIFICVFVILCVWYFDSNWNSKSNNTSNRELIKPIKVIDKTQKLQIMEIKETEIQDIAEMICTELRRSSRSGNDIYKLPGLKEIRHIYCEGKDYYYAVLIDNCGRKLFVFFREVLDDCFWFDSILFMEKQLKYEDFNLLVEGTSTKDDVRKIDSGLDIGQSWEGIDTVDGNTSLHMTQEGVVEILYQKSKIKKISFYTNLLMNEINKLSDFE